MTATKLDVDYMALITEFPLVPLRTKADLQQAVRIMKRLASRHESLKRGERDYLSVLGDLIAQYEKRLPALDGEMTPRDVLLHLMEENNLTQADLVPYVGHKSNLSAFLSGKRGLSKRAVSALAERFSLSPAIFLPKG